MIRADEVGRVFSSTAVLYGVMFLAQGRLYWGQLYLLGLACFATAVVLMHVGPFAPLVYGALLSVAFATISRHLDRVSRRHARAGASA